MDQRVPQQPDPYFLTIEQWARKIEEALKAPGTAGPQNRHDRTETLVVQAERFFQYLFGRCRRPIILLGWSGEVPLLLDPGQHYLVVIAAVCDGWYATLDTSTGRLVPRRVDAPATPGAAPP